MDLKTRFNYLERLFNYLQSTNSLVEKRMAVNLIPKDLQEDFNYILEILSGQHKFGFTYYKRYENEELPDKVNTMTVKEYISQLEYCNNTQCWSMEAIKYACDKCKWFEDLVEQIVNRKLKLGIGKSLLPKDGYSAMLGKSFDDAKIIVSGCKYFVTEKLDGNRCIARFDGLKWIFTSRNGKPMKVNFDMEGLPTEYVYDGEIMSKEQTLASMNLYNHIKADMLIVDKYEKSFNSTSGLINSKYGDKSGLVYNIFDIMVDDVPYEERREMLNYINDSNIHTIHPQWRILPVLAYHDSLNLHKNIHVLLDKVTLNGAEGLMINKANAYYQHKRTNDLLKYKKVKTMDLKVIDIEDGTGKYEGMVGALVCAADFGNKFVTVQVGSGLTDEQRWKWSIKPEEILGKIVEIAYFSESQNKTTEGTIYYSLRFPRLKTVRNDKTEVSND